MEKKPRSKEESGKNRDTKSGEKTKVRLCQCSQLEKLTAGLATSAARRNQSSDK